MVDESPNNPQDLAKERYVQLEALVTNVNHNVNLLMVALTNNPRLFREEEGFNVEVRSWGNPHIGNRQRGNLRKNPKRKTQFECSEPFIVPIQNESEHQHQAISRWQ